MVLVRRRSTNSPMAFKEWRRTMHEELKMNNLFSARTATLLLIGVVFIFNWAKLHQFIPTSLH